MIVCNIRQGNFDTKGCRTRDNKILDPPHWSCLGNPYYLRDPDDDQERWAVIALYELYFYDRIAKDVAFREYVLSLRGKRVACFCEPKACHLHVVRDWLERNP